MAIAMALPWLGLAGCRPAVATSNAPTEAARAEGATTDVWDVFYLQGAKIGYGHTLVRPLERDGQRLVEVGILNHLEVARFGEKSEQVLKSRSVETPDGRVLDFVSETTFGPTPTVVTGRVEGQELVITARTSGAAQTRRIGWSDDIRGFYGVEQSLEQKPMVPGEKRTIKALMPVVNQVAEIELQAKDLETTDVLGAETRLLRIETIARLGGGNDLDTTLWTDPQGQTIKSLVKSLKQATYRTTRQVALAKPSRKQKFDLGVDMIVKLDKPLAHPRETRRVRYRVELASGDPLKAFAADQTQAVRSLGPHVAEVTVTRIDPRQLAPSSAATPAAPAEYLAANNILQIDDPRIRAMAQEASAAPKAPWRPPWPWSGTSTGSSRRKTFHRPLPRRPTWPVRVKAIARNTPCCWRRWHAPAAFRRGWRWGWSTSRGSAASATTCGPNCTCRASGCRSTPSQAAAARAPPT